MKFNQSTPYFNVKRATGVIFAKEKKDNIRKNNIVNWCFLTFENTKQYVTSNKLSQGVSCKIQLKHSFFRCQRVYRGYFCQREKKDKIRKNCNGVFWPLETQNNMWHLINKVKEFFVKFNQSASTPFFGVNGSTGVIFAKRGKKRQNDALVLSQI